VSALPVPPAPGPSRGLPDTSALAADLADWVPRQRWFAGKARTRVGLRVVDFAGLGDGLVLVVVEVDYDEGAPERYQVPLVAMTAPGDREVVARAGRYVFEEATAEDVTCRRLAELATDEGATVTAGGLAVTGTRVEDPGELGAVRRLGVEQSNTSVVLGDRLMLKVLRRLEPGESPEAELTRALTEAGSPHVPALRGVLSAVDGDGNETVLATLADFVAGGREGWQLAAAVAARLAGAAAGGPAGDVDDADPEAGGSAAWLRERVRDLGVALAEVHATLAERLGSRPATAADGRAWAEATRRQLRRALEEARRSDPARTAAVLAAEDRLGRALDAVADVGDPGVLLRIHGDLHLQQVLLEPSTSSWKFLDWEGEPAKPLAERRAPASPLRDVAGMLRSFDYVVGAAGDDPILAGWRDGLRAALLDGYLPAARAAGLLPADDASTAALLDAFELDKAVYELRYELANRPDWVGIPAGGIARLLDDPPGDAMSTPSRPSPVSPLRRTPSPAWSPQWKAAPEEVAGLLEGRHQNPHGVLGLHALPGGGAVVRVFRPDATAVTVLPAGADPVEAERTHPAGLFEARLDRQPAGPADYRLRVACGDDAYESADPYAFWPTLGDVDLHLFGEGRHEELWRRLGAHVLTTQEVAGTAFAVWAPNARSVRVVGDFNSWDGRLHPMRMMGSSGVWELFVPGTGAGAHYKYEIVTAQGALQTRADPFAFWTDVSPGTASRVHESTYRWGDADWMAGRGTASSPVAAPMSVYEVHLASWRRHEDGTPLSYPELAEQLVDHVTRLGFTHVELLPVAEHPYGGSWGYQVTGYYAPTSRFGDPDGFRHLVDRLHQAGIGVIVDWVPAHFPKDDWALARFDGTALYEHADPRQGEHPDWGTLVFNFGRNEVRNFLLANALYWLEELHVDGLRVDAVASMLYLDYSRKAGEWVPNRYGGRENLEAVDFLRELNSRVYRRNPHAMVIAEESTAWPGVSRPAHLGGLGFGFKWNMGWMHDTLSYFSKDPIYRRFHHNELTFSLMYAFSENFVLPLSHDEVVHGKRALLDKMPGDRWQKFANLRALYAYMWAHPGKQLLFMGGELGQWREWSEERSLDWHLLAEADHAGLQRMVGDLNQAYRALPALWEADNDPAGFTWIDANNAEDNVIAFLRHARDGSGPVACLANLSPVIRTLRVGLPRSGVWREALNTDSGFYGGGDVGNRGAVTAEEIGWQGQPSSALVTIPPLGVLWLTPA